MKLILSLVLASFFAFGFQSKPAAKAAAPKKPAAPTFKDVETIFSQNCTGCHSGDRAKHGIDLSSYDSVIAGGEDGPIVKKGAPKHSVLVQALRGMPGVRQMPPRRDPLPEEKIALIEKWILAGAKE